MCLNSQLNQISTMATDSIASTVSSSCSFFDVDDVKPGGISIELFIDKIDETLLCCICKHVLRSPFSTECGCTFCQGCIQQHIQTLSKEDFHTCPSCEETFKLNKTAPAFSTKRKIKNLSMHCPHHRNGCPDTFLQGKMNSHLSECRYVIIKCIRDPCDKTLMRKDLMDHLNTECHYRMITCIHCEVEFTATDHDAHVNKCIAQLKQCPECGHKIHQDKMENHLTISCPEKIINCFFFNYGCNYSCCRKNMKTHKNDPLSISNHLQMVTHAVETFRLEKAEQQLAMQELTNNLNIVERTANEATVKMNSVQQSTSENEHFIRELQKVSAKGADGMTALEIKMKEVASQEVAEIRKNMLKPLQEKQNDMDDRLQRMECKDKARVGGWVEDDAGISNTRVGSVQHQIRMHSDELAKHNRHFELLESTNYDGVLIWKIRDFHRREQDAISGKTLSLYSQPFYTSRYGYKMCARIYLNGDGMGKNTHLSLFFVVMRGNYDALLPWPFRQKVTLMLMDQETGRLHLSDSFRPDPKSSSFQRPTAEMNIASGCPMFVNRTVLDDNTYKKDDVLFVKIIVDTNDLYGP